MKCPICNIDLMMSDRHGIEVDYCPECRGVWLDRGELDKIIDRSAKDLGGGRNVEYEEQKVARNVNSDRDFRERGYNGEHRGRRRERESFLGDIFDF